MPSANLILQNFKTGMIDEDILSQMDYPEGAASDALNVMFTPVGALTKRKGISKLHSTAISGGDGISKIYQWETKTGYEYTFVCTCSGTASATINTMSTTGAEASFESILVTSGTWEPVSSNPISMTTYAGSAIFTYDGMNMGPVTWDGEIDNAITLTAAPSGAKVCLGWGAYLFLGNVASGSDRMGSRAYWCDPLIPTSWPSASYNAFDEDDGDQIKAMVNFKDYILIFKKYKTFKLQYVGGSLTFQQERVSATIGCVGPNAIYEDKGYLYWIGDKGFYRWDGSSAIEDIGKSIQKSINSYNPAVDYLFEVYGDPERFQVWFNVAHGSSDTKDRIYVFDTRYKGWSRFDLEINTASLIRYGSDMTFASLVEAYSTYGLRISDALGEKETTLVTGSYDGFVEIYGTTDSDDGVAIEAHWISPWFTFDEPDKNKRILRATAFIERMGDYDLLVDVYKDWNTVDAVSNQTVSLSGDVSTTMIEQRLDFTLSCRAVRFHIGTAEVDSPFILHKMLVEYRVAGRTKV